jgi:hypothetical protein
MLTALQLCLVHSIVVRMFIMTNGFELVLYCLHFIHLSHQYYYVQVRSQKALDFTRVARPTFVYSLSASFVHAAWHDVKL